MKKTIVALLALVTLNLNATTTSVFDKASETVSKTFDKTVTLADTVFTKTTNAAVGAYNFTDTSSTFKEMYHDAKYAIVVLAQQFKTTTEKVLYIIGKKYFLQGIFSWITLIITLLTTWFVYRKITKSIKENTNELSPIPLLYLPLIFVLGLSTIFCYHTLQDAVNYTFNPEYYVLQDIITIVKSFK